MIMSNRLLSESESRICSFCELSLGGCPYDLFAPPSFPCKDYIPLYASRDKGGLSGEDQDLKDSKGKKTRYNSEASRRYYIAHRSQRKAYQQMYRDLNKEAIRIKDKIYNDTKRKTNKL